MHNIKCFQSQNIMKNKKANGTVKKKKNKEGNMLTLVE